MRHDFDDHDAPAHIRCLVYSMSLSCIVTGSTDKTPMSTMTEAMAEYEGEHAFARQLILPEEDRARYTSAKWEGGYRWFRSPNVVCLEKYRRLKTFRKVDVLL